jgi:hypothetical protein
MDNFHTLSEQYRVNIGRVYSSLDERPAAGYASLCQSTTKVQQLDVANAFV